MTALEFAGKIETLNTDTATFLKAFFITKLPNEVRATLANTEFDNLTEMAIAADKVIKAKKKQINNIHDEFEDEIDAVSQRGRFAPRGGQARGSSSRGGQPPSSGKAQGRTEGKGSCYYHDKHGPAAFRCAGNGCVWANTPLAPKPAGNAPAGR